jgi:uncharacterized membrane protein YjjP (DUF1212 family)
MTPFILISLFIGFLLGQRFKVLILVPGLALTLIVTFGAEVARGEAIWAIARMEMALITSLQMGYLAGTGMRHLLIVARAR